MSNREGHAAKVYFNALFGMEFTRALSTPENAALNYGYQKINMLMLENHASDPIYPFENVLLFDSDMCELHLDSSDEIG